MAGEERCWVSKLGIIPIAEGHPRKEPYLLKQRVNIKFLVGKKEMMDIATRINTYYLLKFRGAFFDEVRY
jgi:hypothetical protein